MGDDRSNALHALVMQHLDDDQAQDIVTIDLEGKSSMADHMVVASGRSTRQVASIAQKLAENGIKGMKLDLAGFRGEVSSSNI